MIKLILKETIGNRADYLYIPGNKGEPGEISIDGEEVKIISKAENDIGA